MRKIFCAATIALVCVQAGKATADGMTGQDCQEFSDGLRGMYMFAFVDGYIVGAIDFGPEALDDIIDNLIECVDGKTAKQLGAVLKKWLDDNPEMWDKVCWRSANIALSDMCESEGIPIWGLSR